MKYHFPVPIIQRMMSQGQCQAGLVKSWCCTSCAFIPISLRGFPPPCKGGGTVFPPLAKGGLGGVVPARPVTRSSHALSLSVLSHPSGEARRIVFDFQGSRITPPAPPSQGGERDRSLATSFHRAQQKHASRYHAGPSPPQPVQSETGEERADWTSPGGGLSGCRGRCWVGGSGIVRDRIGHGATTGRIGRIRGLLDGRQGGIGHAQERSGIFLPAFARAPVPRSSRRCGGCIARRSQVGSARIGKRRPRGSVRLRGLRPIAGRGTRPGRVGLGNIERRGLCS